MMERDQDGIVGRNSPLPPEIQRRDGRFQAHTPDVDGEAAVAAHGVLVGTLQGDGGFGSSAHFTAEHHGLAKRTHHVRQGVEELRSHCMHGNTTLTTAASILRSISDMTYFEKISPVDQLCG